MTHGEDRRGGDTGVVLRTLTAILLSGGTLLAAVEGRADVAAGWCAAGMAVLWGSLAVEAVAFWRRMSARRLDWLQLVLDLGAVATVVAAAPGATGLSVFLLGPVATAALRLGREGAFAASTLAALGLLLPAVIGGGVGALPASTGLGAVLLLASGLVAAELVRLAARRRRQEARTARQARRAGHELQMVLDNLGSGLLTVDAGGHVTRINPLARTILGLDADVRRGQPLGVALGEGARPLAELVLRALADGKPCRRAEVQVYRSRTAVPLGVNVVFLTDEENELVGAVAVFTDLTEVRRLQEHLRRSDRLAGVGELAASIAHELRNPLASIRGSVELLAGELELEGHQAQLMQLILRESGRLNTIITDFLNFARLRPSQPLPLALDGFLDQVMLQLRQHITAHGGAVDVASDVQQPGLTLQADGEQLVQALLNLGINACEAMHYEGRLQLMVDAVDGACELRLRDTGPGLDPERMEEIFTPFVTTKQHGTGLGLPMVARVVHGHGGTVEAGNGPAGGAEFVLRLPLATPADIPGPAAEAIVAEIDVLEPEIVH